MPAEQPALSSAATTSTAGTRESLADHTSSPAQPPPPTFANGDSASVQKEVSSPEDTAFASSKTSQTQAASHAPTPGSAAPVPDTKHSPAVVGASHQEVSESLSKPANGHAVTPAPPAVQTQANVQDGEKSKKRQSFLTRTLWTFIMIGGFLGTHPCVYLMIDLTQ